MSEVKTESGIRRAITAAAKAEKERGLLLVGLFKLSKAIFFTAVGVGALHLVHRDIGDMVQNMIDAMHFSSENHFVDMIADKADLIGHHQLRQAGMASIGYAVLCLVEGIGLITRQVWAEYLTVVLTTMGLPYEVYEIINHYTHLKVGVMLLNIVILLYLLWILKKKRPAKDVAVGVSG